MIDVVRWIAVLSVVYLTAGIAWLAFVPGPGVVGLLVIAIGLVVAWIGAVGAVLKRFRPVVVGAAGMALVGFAQPALLSFALPAIVLLLAVAALLWRAGEVPA